MLLSFPPHELAWRARAPFAGGGKAVGEAARPWSKPRAAERRFQTVLQDPEARFDAPRRADQARVADLAKLVLLRHKRRRFVCLIGRMQQGQRERFRTMATISLRRIVAIEFGM